MHCNKFYYSRVKEHVYILPAEKLIKQFNKKYINSGNIQSGQVLLVGWLRNCSNSQDAVKVALLFTKTILFDRLSLVTSAGKTPALTSPCLAFERNSQCERLSYMDLFLFKWWDPSPHTHPGPFPPTTLAMLCI